MCSLLTCAAQRISYVISQNVVDNYNETSNFVLTTAPVLTSHAVHELVMSGNGSLEIPTGSSLYCNAGRYICECRLRDKFRDNYPIKEGGNFSAMWELALNEDHYELQPIYSSHDFIQVEFDALSISSNLNDDVCLNPIAEGNILSCYTDAVIAEVHLSYQKSFEFHENFTMLNADKELHTRDPCQGFRRQPNAYVCRCSVTCSMLGVYNLTVNQKHPQLRINLTGISEDNNTNVYIIFPKQFTHRPKFCDKSDISGFLLDATSLKTVDFVLSIVSLLSLFLTIFVFATCPELRNLHGKNLMSLSVTIFFSQILFLHDVGLLNDKLCAGIGALLHYCWLSIFIWTSTMAYDLARTFRVQSALNHRNLSDKSKLYMKYAVVAWGGPAVVIVICLIANWELDDTLYGTVVDGGVCMASFYVMVYGLFLPFAISVVFNVICFVIIVHGIESNKTKFPKKNQNSLEKTRCFIYGKISALLGLSWIICLLATIQASRTFWFSFSIMSNLQGVGIFVSFILLNRRVRGVVKRQLASQDNVETAIPNVRSTYDSVRRDRSMSCLSDDVINRTTSEDEFARYENPMYAPDEIENE